MKLTNKFGLPDTLYNAIKCLIYDPRESDPNRISITTLINNPRPRILSLKHWDEIEEDASDHIWRILGSGIHDIIEKMSKANSLNTLSEEKLTAEVGGMTVVGKLDLYDGTLCSVEDWKVTSIWSVTFGEHEEWERQLNPYAWLLRKAGFDVKRLQINAILKDWRRGESYRGGDYPPIPFKTIPVKLWTFEQQQDFVEHRVEIFKEARKTPIEDLPICSDTERWKKDDQYAIYKAKGKKASRVLDTANEAEAWAKENIDAKDGYRIEKRDGGDLKCQEYCTVNKHCCYWQEKYGGK